MDAYVGGLGGQFGDVLVVFLVLLFLEGGETGLGLHRYLLL